MGPSVAGTVTRPVRELIVFAPQQQFYFEGDQWWDNPALAIIGVTGSADTKAYFNKAYTSATYSKLTNETIFHNQTFKVTPTAEPPATPAETDRIFVSRTTTSGFYPLLFYPAQLSWEAIVTTTDPHGLALHDAVVLSDDAGSSAQLAGTYFVVSVVNATQFKLRVPPIPWPGTSPTVHWQKVIHRFDEAMRGVPASSRIHLGPGTFETRGSVGAYIPSSGPQTAGWQLKSGQYLAGSGMDVTTLKLVFALDPINQTQAIVSSSELFQNEVSDLTVDCNLPCQLAPRGMAFAPVACGAVLMAGRHLTIRRVRAVRWGTQTRAECFVLLLNEYSNGTQPATFNVIEDCVVEHPSTNNTHETTLIGNVGNRYGSGRSLIVRNNYVNCRYVTTSPPQDVSSELIPILSITSLANDEATVTTKRPHLRSAREHLTVTRVTNTANAQQYHPLNQPLLIKAVLDATTLLCHCPGASSYPAFIVENPGDSSRAHAGVDFHGPAAGSGTGCVTEDNAVYDCLNCFYNDTGSTRDGVVRDNYYSNIGQGVFMNFPPTQFEGFVGASAIVPENAPEDSGKKHGVFTTLQPHNLSVNDTVTIREAGEAQPRDNPNVAGFNPYHGTTLLVVGKRGPDPSHQFVYRLANQTAALPVNNCAGRPVFRPSIATSTFAFVSSGPTAGEVTVVTASDHGLVNGDFVTFVGVAPSLTPTNPPAGGSFSSYNGIWGPITPDLTNTKKFRFNINDTVSDPTKHPMKDSGTGGTMDRHVAAGVVRNGTVATVTTVAPHGYFLGQFVKVQGAWVNGSQNNGYNGGVTVKSTTERTFSCDLKPVGGSVPGGSASPTGPLTYSAHWDFRHFVLENNAYDLYATDATNTTYPRGVSMFGLEKPDSPAYIFPAFVFRKNLVRHIDHAPGVAERPTYGIYATTIGAGLIDYNLIDTNAVHPLTYRVSGQLTHLQNTTGRGGLIRGFDITASVNKPIDDLETRIADALSMALL